MRRISKDITKHYQMACSSMSYTPFAFYRLMFSMCLFCLFAARRVFLAGLDGATGVAQVSGGGGTSNDMPWRDKDDDLLDWARRAMRYAHAKHYPGNRFKRSLSK